MEFLVGQVVKLKSGGPAMTIVDAGDSQAIILSWFADRNTPKTASYPASALEYANADSAGAKAPQVLAASLP